MSLIYLHLNLMDATARVLGIIFAKIQYNGEFITVEQKFKIKVMSFIHKAAQMFLLGA